jgi:tetratricopeptide (TPR) repeat protein
LYFPLGEKDNCTAEHEKALHYGRESGSTEAQARAYSGLADAHYLSGRMLSAGQMFERCIDLAKQNNLTSIVSTNLAMLGPSKIYALEFAAGNTLVEEALRLSSTIGNYRAEILGRIRLMHLQFEEGLNEDLSANAKIAFDMSQEYGVEVFAGSALLHQSRAYFEMGQLDKAVEAAEDVWGRVIKNHFENFYGPSVLAVIACASPDEEQRNWAIDEGHCILSEGAVGHNHLYFYRFLMEAGLEQGDWELLQSARDALAEFTRAEPLPLTDFLMARASALRDFYQGHDRDAAIGSLHGLKIQAERVGLKVALPRLEAAISEAGH